MAVKAEIRFATPRKIYTVYENGKLGPNQVYKQESTPEDFALESQYIEIVFSATANAPSPAWYIDDVSFVPTPLTACPEDNRTDSHFGAIVVPASPVLDKASTPKLKAA